MIADEDANEENEAEGSEQDGKVAEDESNKFKEEEEDEADNLQIIRNAKQDREEGKFFFFFSSCCFFFSCFFFSSSSCFFFFLARGTSCMLLHLLWLLLVASSFFPLLLLASCSLVLFYFSCCYCAEIFFSVSVSLSFVVLQLSQKFRERGYGTDLQLEVTENKRVISSLASFSHFLFCLECGREYCRRR